MRVHQYAKSMKVENGLILHILEENQIAGYTALSGLTEMEIKLLDTTLNKKYTVKAVRTELHKRFGVKGLDLEVVGMAGGLFAPIGEKSIVKKTIDTIAEALIREGALEPVTEPEQVAPKAARKSRSRVGNSLELVERKSRPKSLDDQDNLIWLQQVIDADKALKTAGDKGKPYRPEVRSATNAFGEKGFVYDDPFSQFLDPREVSRFARKGGVNGIFITLEKYNLFQAEPERSYQWRSNEIMRKFERKFYSLWAVDKTCRQCGKDIEGTWDDMKRLLRGERYLPDTPNVPPRRIFTGARFHPWCVSIRSELVDLEVKLQGAAGESQEAQAQRSAFYVDMLSRVTQQHEEVGATSAIVIDAFRSYLHNMKEMIRNAG